MEQQCSRDPQLLLLLVVLLSVTTSVLGKQSFEQEPGYKEVNPGETTVLSCRVFKKSRNSDCIWQKDGKPIRLQDGKYEWDGSQDSGDCSLKVISADINYDDGTTFRKIRRERNIGRVKIKTKTYYVSGRSIVNS